MKLDGKQPPQMNLDIEKDTKVISCKNKLVDLETGQEYIGQVWTEDNPYFWKNIDED